METLLVKREGAIYEIMLNRPKSLNALNPEMIRDLGQALAEAQAEKFRCVVFKGAGEHFMAGGDVRFFGESLYLAGPERHRRFYEFVAGIYPLVQGISRLRKPVIASVQGAVAGFGVSLALMCDFAIASSNCYFNLAYVNLGTSPDGSCTYFLPRVVGLRKAKELAMLGDRIDAEQALACGLITRVVPRENLAEETEKLATRLAHGPTIAYGHIKSLLHESFQRSLPEQLEAEAEAFAACAVTEDFAEGVQGFLEKRKTKFKGM